MKQCPECKRSYDDTIAFCVFDGKQLATAQEVDTFIGKILEGKYRIDRKIARGGSGNVYKATHIQLSAPVAIKIIHQRLASDNLAVERFRREAFITMRVRHTNAIAVMDFGITENKVVYVVTELLEGATLDQRLRQLGHISPLETNHIMQQVCAAVSVAHEHQIIHRDLKPENIYLHRDEGGREVVKVVDFGIAKYKGKMDDESEMMKLTQAGFVVGTPSYMSPEQCSGMDVDARSDIYSLGVMLYQLLTGRLPFEATKAGILVMKHKNEKPRPLYEVKQGLPAVLNAVVMRSLEKKPEDRQQTALELANELKAAVKAITEQELQHVFMNATEGDLEAALLLATEPASGFGSLSDILSRPTTEIALDTANLSESKIVAVSEGRPTPSDDSFSLQIDSMFLELLHSSRELSTLLELVVNSLENNVPPDMILFNELKTSADQLRGLLFSIKKSHYKTLI